MRDSRFASMEQRDSETTLDPTLFRMYESRLYRWMSPDPLAGSIFDPQSLNRYAYVLNNPTNLIDPLGLHYHCPHMPPIPPIPPYPPGGDGEGGDGGGPGGGPSSGTLGQGNAAFPGW